VAVANIVYSFELLYQPLLKEMIEGNGISERTIV
jgi:hypothetical protein